MRQPTPPRKGSAALFTSLSSLAFIPIIKTALAEVNAGTGSPMRRVRPREVQKLAPGSRARSVVPVQKTECVFCVPRSGAFGERSNAV